MTQDIKESKIAKDINKNVADDKLKHKNYKNVYFNRRYMRHEVNRIHSKNHNIGLYRRRVLCVLTKTENRYLKMDIVGYHIIINLRRI